MTLLIVTHEVSLFNFEVTRVHKSVHWSSLTKSFKYYTKGYNIKKHDNFISNESRLLELLLTAIVCVKSE